MAGTEDVQIWDIASLRDTVINLTAAVAILQEQMQGLTSNPTSDPGEHYAGDQGPAVRTWFVENSRESDRSNAHELEGRIASLEVIIGNINGTQGEYQEAVDALVASVSRLEESQEEHMQKIKFLTDKSEPSASRTSSYSKDAITNTRGVDKIKPYTGDVSMWKECGFKMETWLGSINPSFQTLVKKLDKSEKEPEEPEEGTMMNIGPEEITTDEEWRSEQLYLMLVQKTEVPALAIIRNLNTHGEARGLSAWYRTMRDAEGQVEVKKDESMRRCIIQDAKQ